MANNRNKTKGSPQPDMFGDQIHQTAAPVRNTFERRTQEHAERYRQVNSPSLIELAHEYI